MIKKLLIVLWLCCSATPCHAWPARVVAVVDGDTITVEPIDGGERMKIRLYGIDAPELKQPFGETARSFVSAKSLYQQVSIEVKSRDRYGRVVAIVWLPAGESLQAAMLNAGLAWLWPQYCRNCQDWEKLQATAQRFCEGLWGEEVPVPPWEWRRGKRR